MGEGKRWEVREETNGEKTRVVVAPEDMEPREKPTSLGKVELDGEMAKGLLTAVAWYGHGSKEAEACSVYVYDQDLASVRVGLDISVERFSDGEYGQGYRFDMRPTVSPEKLPLTAEEDEPIEESDELPETRIDEEG